MTPLTEPLGLARALIRCPSVTPDDAGALDVLEATLEELGFSCHKLVFSEQGTADVANLYARLGEASPNFCFAGHTDVVPVGNPESWDTDPFGAEIIDAGYRGMSDETVVLGDAETVAEQLSAFAELGFSDVIVRCLSRDQNTAVATITQLANVRSSLAPL